MNFTYTIQFKNTGIKLYGKPLGLRHLDEARAQLGNQITDVSLDNSLLLVRYSASNAEESAQVVANTAYTYDLSLSKGTLSVYLDEIVARKLGNVFKESSVVVADMPEAQSWDDYLTDIAYVLNEGSSTAAKGMYVLNLLKLVRDLRNNSQL